MECEAVWTGNAYQKLFNYQGDYPIYKTTSCAISYALGISDYCGLKLTNLRNI